MKSEHLSTSQVAKAAGVHPNTVRLYEAWGFIPSVPRSPSGYRLFVEAHIDHMRLARMMLKGPFAGKKIRHSALDLIRLAATGDLGGALESAYHHLALVQSERAHAEAAVKMLERWAQGTAADASSERMQIGEVAQRLGVSRDVLRNWERNGLISVPRHPENRYRLYTSAEISRLRVIRMLSQAGYSMMAILRMVLYLDNQGGMNLRQVLDTPRPDEDAYMAADRWLTELAEQETRAEKSIEFLEGMIAKQELDHILHPKITFDSLGDL
ncbi:MAG: MerR family transcriptional regulator [Anaerolineales bacterium]|nr:MerR family transcriptional regulator [Anaerolineales bacterium]